MSHSLAIEILSRLAQQNNLTIISEPNFNYAAIIILPNGQRWPIINWHLGINSQSAAQMAKDKDFSRYFLKLAGWSTPRSRAFYSDAWCEAIGSDRNSRQAFKYAETLNWPIVIKPNSDSGGHMVYLIEKKSDFEEAINEIFNQHKIMLIEEFLSGREFRVVVLDREIKLVYEKAQSLKSDSLTKFKSPASNLSLGGEIIKELEEIHPRWQEILIKMVSDLGLRWAGIDIISQADLTEIPKEYSVLEINASPGFDHYAALGERQNRKVKAILTELWEKVISENS